MIKNLIERRAAAMRLFQVAASLNSAHAQGCAVRFALAPVRYLPSRHPRRIAAMNAAICNCGI